jgi:hypothetical protein
MPSVATSPSPIANFVITTFFETVMFSFTALNDIDLDSYAYRLYDNELGTGTPVAQGRNKANVFTISVPNTTDSTPKRYWGQVAAVNSAGVVAAYTPLQSDQATPQIGSQYISTLTADKIRAGTIGAYEIILNGSGSILKSSNYDPSVPIGSRQGWTIKGDGTAEFSSASIRGSISASSLYFNSNNRWGRNSGNTADSSEFKIGTNSSYLFYDFTNNKVTFTGELSAASGTFTGRLEVGGVDIGNDVGPGTGHYGISLSTTDFNNIFLRRASDGVYFFRIGQGGANSITWDSSSGALNVTGTINASGGTITGYLTSGGVDIGVLRPGGNNYYKGINLSPNNATDFQSCFIRGDGGEVYLRADNGTQWIKFENGSVQIKASNLEITSTGATFTGALSGASGSVTTGFNIGADCVIGANASIGDNLYVANYVRINGPAASNVTVTKIRGFKNLGDTDANARWSLVLEGPNGTNKWEVRDDGLMQYRTQSAYSDMRIKTNIQTSNLGLDFINSLKPRSYNLSLGENEEGIEVFKQVKTYGFVAQEVKEVYERYTESFDGWGLSVANDDESLQTISYDNFISPLVKAIQELSTKVDELESRLV